MKSMVGCSTVPILETFTTLLTAKLCTLDYSTFYIVQTKKFCQLSEQQLSTKRETGKIDDVYELSNSGFNIFAGVNPAVAGGFEHQGFFALIDKNGYIRSRRDSNGNPIVYYLGIENKSVDKQGIDMIKEDIRKLLKNG